MPYDHTPGYNKMVGWLDQAANALLNPASNQNAMTMLDSAAETLGPYMKPAAMNALPEIARGPAGAVWDKARYYSRNPYELGNDAGALAREMFPVSGFLEEYRQLVKNVTGEDLATTKREEFPVGGLPPVMREAVQAYGPNRTVDTLTHAAGMVLNTDPIPEATIGNALYAITTPILGKALKAPSAIKEIGERVAQNLTFEHGTPQALKQIQDVVVPPTGSLAKTMAAVDPAKVENAAARELAGLYNQGKIDLPEAQQYFDQYMQRDEAGKSAFDKIWDKELEINRARILNPKAKKYIPKEMDVSDINKDNTKLGVEIIPKDTSRGCLGLCTGCYACQGQSGMGKEFIFPEKVELSGNASNMLDKDKYAVWRFGENGEPGFDPDIWIEMGLEDKLRKHLEEGGHLTSRELFDFAKPAYNWKRTNAELAKTGFGGTASDRMYVISKLQSIEGFDPNLVRNLQVSVDPGNPDHFFRTLENVKKLKEIHPEVNLQLRIRSVSTFSDEINALQKVAVDFANQNNLKVLETRLRFKDAGSLSDYAVQPEYWEKAAIGQKMHGSYYPSVGDVSTVPTHTRATNESVLSYDVRGFKGPEATSVYSTGPQKHPNGEPIDALRDKVFTLWDGGDVVAANVTKSQAHDMAQELLQGKGAMPGKVAVREFTQGNSPLSQMGLRPDLHLSCNTFNMGGNACGTCKNCRAFINAGIQNKTERKLADSPTLSSVGPGTSLLDQNVTPNADPVKMQYEDLVRNVLEAREKKAGGLASGAASGSQSIPAEQLAKSGSGEGIIGEAGYNLHNFAGRVSRYTKNRQEAQTTVEGLNRAYANADAYMMEPYPGLYEINWRSAGQPATTRVKPEPVTYRKGRMSASQREKAGIEEWPPWIENKSEVRQPQKTAPEMIATETGMRAQKDVDAELADQLRRDLAARKGEGSTRKIYDQQSLEDDMTGIGERVNRVLYVEDDERLSNLKNILPPDRIPPQAEFPKVTIYRGVPDSIQDATIRPGDWVALSPKYAKEHGLGGTGTGKNRILKERVPTEDVVWAGSDMNEFFYAPKALQQQRNEGEKPWEYLNRVGDDTFLGKINTRDLAARKANVPAPGAPASTLTKEHLLNGETLGEVEQRVLDGNSGIRDELGKILTARIEREGPEGFNTFQDWMNPGKVGSRIRQELTQRGMSHREAMDQIGPLVKQYEAKYKEVVEKYRKALSKSDPNILKAAAPLAAAGLAGKAYMQQQDDDPRTQYQRIVDQVMRGQH